MRARAFYASCPVYVGTPKRTGEPVPPFPGVHPGMCVSRGGHLRSARALDSEGHSKSREGRDADDDDDDDALVRENAEDESRYARYDAELSLALSSSDSLMGLIMGHCARELARRKFSTLTFSS